jgi:hypothetical protein
MYSKYTYTINIMHITLLDAYDFVEDELFKKEFLWSNFYELKFI